MEDKKPKKEFADKAKEFYAKHRAKIIVGLGIANAALSCYYFYLKGWKKGWNKGFEDGETTMSGIIGTVLWNNDKDLYNAADKLMTKENVKKALEVSPKH